MDKIKFQTNVPVEVALRFTEGKLCDSQFGDPQYMFSTMDDRAFFVAAKVAQKIHGLRLKPGELIDTVKAEVPYTNGRKGIEWQISRVNPPEGDQPNGTFVVPTSHPNGVPVVGRVVPAKGPQPGASVSAPAPVTAAPNTVTSLAQPPSNGNGNANGSRAAERFWAGKLKVEQPQPPNATQPPNGDGANNSSNGNNGHGDPRVVVSDSRPKTRLEDALKTVVAAVHATNEYAKTIGYAMPQFTSEDLRTMANTLMIAAKNGGN